MSRCLAFLLLVAFALAARAEMRLPGDAFVAPAECHAPTSVAATLEQRIATFVPQCGAQRTKFDMSGSNVQAAGSKPSVLRARFSQVASERFGAMLTTLKLGWTGASQPANDWRMRGGESITAGSLLQVEPRFALRAQWGLDPNQASRNRTRLAGLWAPSERRFLYAEWDQREEERTETHTLGMRWWLVPRKVALDVAAQWVPRLPDAAQPSVGLVLPVW